MTTPWPVERARRWQSESGWLVGCNFTPSCAGSQLEMWQPATFAPDIIDRELSWAAGLGMNVVRVYLHNLLFDQDQDGFLARIDQVLGLAEAYGIRMLPVLFDGVWHPRPRLGVQPEPRPRVHNSIWVQAPGSSVLHDRTQWPDLRPYVEAVVTRFAQDPRVVAWDLFNEPDQVDALTIAGDSRAAKAEAATELVACVFDWVRAIDPAQPLTVGIWEYGPDHQPAANALNEMILARSDILSFHCYEPRAQLNA
ncbi:MAG: cellulase family glycosylhydrolase, partial [Pseudomonadota bacterium]